MMVLTDTPTQLYVNPLSGSDEGSGTQTDPYQTLTRALKQAIAGTKVYLANGHYTSASGEAFPMVIPAGVSVIGNESAKGRGVQIEGGGLFQSATFGTQSIAIALADAAELRGVTLINPIDKGTGIWIESTAPIVANNTLTRSSRAGVFATGTANPLIEGNLVEENAASGIFFVRNARGEIRGNVCRRTGYGIVVGDTAAPLILDNQSTENRAGLVVSRSARPVLRGNQIDRNTGDGLVVTENALPDLGDRQDPGDNSFAHNEGVDLRNVTSATLLSAGNWLNPNRVVGKVDFVVSESHLLGAASAPSQPSPSPIGSTPPRLSPTPTPAPVAVPPTAPKPILSAVAVTDIADHWAEAWIQGLVARRVISGFPDKTFRPDATITRAEFAVILANAFDRPLRLTPQRFTDVTESFWGAAAIAKAQQMGFLAGFPDGTFRPQLPLTRIQSMVALVNGLQLTGGQPSLLEIYRDRVQIPSYAIHAVAAATQTQLIVNYPAVTVLNPLAETTRAEVAALVYQGLVVLLQAPPLASPYIAQPSVTAPSFPDVAHHWAAEFIQGLASQRFIAGFDDGTFRPDLSMTRAQYAVLLAHLFNPPIKRAAPQFADVDPSFWAASAIERVYRTGVLSGFEDNTFRPQEPVLRFQVWLSLVNGLTLPEGTLALLNRYTDADTVPAYARRAIATATAHQLVINYPTLAHLEPTRPATRAEVAAILYQALVQHGRLREVRSPYIVQP